MQKIISIAIKNLLTVYRDLKSWSIVFILPVAFIGIFAFVFNRSNDDVNFNLGYIKSESSYQTSFVKEISNLENKKQVKYFNVSEINSIEEGKSKVQSKSLDLIIEFVPDNKVKMYTDTFSTKGNVAVGIMTQFTNSFFTQTQPRLEIISTSTASNETTVFTYLVPGLIVYGILNLLPQVIYMVTSEVRNKSTFRYFTSKIKAWQIILGHLLSQSIIAFIQTIILIITVLIFGYSTTPNAILLALLISIPTNLFTVGMGLVIASSFKNDNLAANIGSLVSIILGFLSGAFLAFPVVKLFGNVTLTQLIPSTYAAEAFRKVLQYNKGFADIIPELSVLTISSIILIVIGSWAYSNFQLKNLVG
jgi:ABC-2 type transport system permease protein